MSYNPQAASWLAQGLCTRCGNPPHVNAKGKTLILCLPCNELKRQRQAARYVSRARPVKPVRVTKGNYKKLITKLNQLDRMLFNALVAQKVQLVGEVEKNPSRERIEVEALEEIKLAGGADNWVKERREEEARRASRETRRSYADNYSSLDTL